MQHTRSSDRRTRRPARHVWAWPVLLCLVALAAACAPAPAVVTTGAPTAIIGETPVAITAAAAPTALPTPSASPTPEASPTTQGSPTTAATATSKASPIPEASPTCEPSPPAEAAATAERGTPVYGYRVVNEYPHDPDAFTQGLVYEDGVFYEGTGLWGESSLRKVELETGEVLQIHNLAPDYFGEGISVVGDRIWQLTWQERVAFLYDKETFEELDTVAYSTEGWGLTYDGERLIMSDGTSTLYFRDPVTFEVLGQVQVYDAGGPVVRLNELEYVDGQVFANIWQTNRIAIIDPTTGKVDAWLDLSGLLDPSDVTQPCDVLNGIAWDAAGERLFVTGKWWPRLFEIEIVGDDAAAFVPLVARQ